VDVLRMYSCLFVGIVRREGRIKVVIDDVNANLMENGWSERELI
jgi:hypothetical protein